MIEFSNVQKLVSLSKIYVFRKRHLRKTEGGALIQMLFSDRTNVVFFAMTTILFRRQTIFTRESVEM